ncbi:GNAT family N-acetyltransferase [Paractinoplanes atraurantiacus]|uniref:Protein N-acetyltransferase, RimJ/RimL family n=1 Tax=Paractinoplanes atraurantiacus TaxID=1036182 RepID=A0A285GYW2_9ACTN|nr:GNAT family N-acetyltransferase [Actinoplanes atraurantiacus]SNY28702.1 Protein N-acetyltransferase, RimJ/RimL family [Actinoplanes atraurantiacus]
MRSAEINGEGVRLRAFRPEDAEALAEGYNDQMSQRFLTVVPSPFTVAQAETFIVERIDSLFAEGGAFYAVADPETDELLGGVGFDKAVPSRGQAEIGYWVGPWARGCGVATAAVRTMSAHAFKHGLHRLELVTHWDNPVSQRVALAAGYQREGVRRGAQPNRDGGRDDMLAFARLASDDGEAVPRLLPDLPGGELTDGVVRLRPLGPGDTAFLTELRSLPDVVNTSVPPVPPTPEKIRQRCFWAEAHWLAGTRADLVIEDAVTGEPAGDIGLFNDEPVTGQAMIGYSMLPAFRGRGFPTRAAQLLSLWVFAETGVARLIAGALPTNKGSQRVLEKAGFRQEAYLRSRLPGPDGGRVDDVQYVLLAEDLLR